MVRCFGAKGLLVASMLIAAPASAEVLFVNAAATGSGDGSSWADAYTSLSPALAGAAPGDEVWVAEGTYQVGTGSGLVLPDGVGLYGGFVGTEALLLERDWSVHETIIAGPGPNPVSSRVLSLTNCGPDTAVDGFTITGGYAIQTPGGGARVQGGSPVFANCTFVGNYASFSSGGGLFIQDSDAAVINCRFQDNYVHLGSGGGLLIFGASAATVADCTFTNNTAVTGSGGNEGQGAGAYNESTVAVMFEGCTFTGNIGRAFYSCCPIEQARGGGLASLWGDTTVRDCVFRGNRAHYGGAVSFLGPGRMINCVMTGNYADPIALSGGATGGGEGGAVNALSFDGEQVELINCTIAGNYAREAAGFVGYYSVNCKLRNTIVWGNVATGEDVDPRNRQFTGNHDIRYSCVQDLLTAPPGEDPYDPADYPGCITNNPMLANSAAGDAHLLVGSPCIDAGQNAALPAGVTLDVEGLPRRVDDPATIDTGAGAAPLVDMGAHEFQVLGLCPGDATGDGVVDFADLNTVLASWALTVAPGTFGDVTDDGVVNFDDLNEVLANWQSACD